MACRDAYKMDQEITSKSVDSIVNEQVIFQDHERLLFGVESKSQANDILQNNLTLLEWVEKNKLSPTFWGRNIVGDNKLTRSEIRYIHQNGCSIAPIYCISSEKFTEEQGISTANEIVRIVTSLGFPEGTAVFLELNEDDYASMEYMYGLSSEMLAHNFIPAFKANTDAIHSFDREFSRGIQLNEDVFKKCVVWAVAPTIPEYNNMTTSHFIHPDNWSPYAPSGITRKDIAIWQYGKDCHPIYNDDNRKVTFNLQLAKDVNSIVDKMY